MNASPPPGPPPSRTPRSSTPRSGTSSSGTAASRNSKAKPLPQSASEQWVFAALNSADRRQRLNELNDWLTWLISQYPSAESKIPPCWYRHPEAVNRLAALYVGWLRTYVEIIDPPKPLALVEWHKALDQTLPNLGFPNRCLSDGTHYNPPGEQNQWATDADFPELLVAGLPGLGTKHPAPGRYRDTAQKIRRGADGTARPAHTHSAPPTPPDHAPEETPATATDSAHPASS